jgi:putative ABC transport system permease protein
MVLFDIQSNQKQAVADLTKSLNLPVLQEVPIVNMRMTEIKGRNAASYKKDSVAWGAMRGLEREYRVTYRDSLSDSEELIDGKWIGKAEPGKPVYVSLEDGYAKRIGVKIGDELTFNVQGAPLKASGWQYPKGGLEPDSDKLYPDISNRCSGGCASVSCAAYPGTFQ